MLSLICSWGLFPLVLALVGAGWGVLIQRLAGERIAGALLAPVGLAAALVVASLLTSWSVSAPASIAVVAAGAAAGVALGWRRRARLRAGLWPGLAAVGVFLVYGAPVILSGSATFAGYIRLDDTATWLGIVDQAMAHGRALGYLPSSSYSLVLHAYVGSSYPLGSFMLLGIGHGLTGIDVAWVFQPYLAVCAAMVGLGVYALTEGAIASPRLRALVAFLGAQSALLYGYSLWGGIKELTSAFLLVAGAALVARAIPADDTAPARVRARKLLGLAITAAALIDTLGAGSVAWVLPALGVLLAARLWRAREVRAREAWRARLAGLAGEVGALVAVTAALALPVWTVLGGFLSSDSNLYAGPSTSENLGNLLRPLSGWQLAGVWPVGDFRLRAPTAPTAVLVGVALLAAVVAISATLRAGRPALAAYVGVALAGCAVFWLVGATPWVIAKSLAIASPALLTAGLAGGALLAGGAPPAPPPLGETAPPNRRRIAGGWGNIARPAGVLVLVVLGAGVLWSNALAYHDVLLAPRARLAELQRIGGLVAGKGPTFLNEYEIYADRHFLREGAPVEPAEYRPVDLPLRDGTLLTKSAWADLDSFAPATLEAYRSLVIPRSPAESRPPSTYKLVWRGRYYELWQRPAHPAERVLAHIPLGESNTLPYCGAAENAPTAPLCSAGPVAVPSCATIAALGRQAAHDRAALLAYQRPEPIVARGDQTSWPAAWGYDRASRTLFPDTPGTALAHIRVDGGQTYKLWLGGSFSRGFEVEVDGRHVGTVADEPRNIGGYAPVANLRLAPGIHTIALTYPHASLAPGSGDNQQTSLTAIVLQPLQRPQPRLLTVAPAQAHTLCGRSLDWIEIVRPR